MNKLTLNAPPEVIASAKRIAARRGTSVSTLFTDFIRSIDAPSKPAVGPLTRRATGLVKLPANKSSRKSTRKLVEDGLARKYLR